MPIIRYFLFVGALLLALLFVAARYLPEAPERFAGGDVDRTIIRIRSARPHPAKVEFDTSDAPSLPASVATDAAHVEDHQREAMAMVPEDRPSQTQPIPLSKERGAKRKPTYRAARRTNERRVAFDHPDFFGGR